MDKLTSNQLEAAQEKLINRMRRARADYDYLTQELPRLILSNTIGIITDGEVSSVRQQLVETKQVLEETPAALVLIKEAIGQFRSMEAQNQQIEYANDMRRNYLSLRREIIGNPSLAEKEPSGRLHGLAVRLGGGKYMKEYEALVYAAKEYNSRIQSQPFSFDVQITE